MKPLARILGKPTWHQKETLVDEAQDLELVMDISYVWSGSWGLLAVIQGAVKYLADTALDYVVPESSPNQNSLLTNANQSAARVRVLTKENNILERNFALYKDFLRLDLLQCVSGTQRDVLSTVVLSHLQV